MWISMPEQRRTSWLSATEAEAALPGNEGPAKVDTLIVTRCRIIALSPGGLTSAPTLVFSDSLANVSDASVGNGVLRLRFAGADRELRVGWRVSNRASPLAPSDLRSLAAGGPGPAQPGTPAPMRRATDRRDGGRFVAESVLDAFARQLAAISG